MASTVVMIELATRQHFKPLIAYAAAVPSFRVSPKGCSPTSVSLKNTSWIQRTTVMTEGQPGSLWGTARRASKILISAKSEIRAHFVSFNFVNKLICNMASRRRGRTNTPEVSVPLDATVPRRTGDRRDAGCPCPMGANAWSASIRSTATIAPSIWRDRGNCGNTHRQPPGAPEFRNTQRYGGKFFTGYQYMAPTQYDVGRAPEAPVEAGSVSSGFFNRWNFNQFATKLRACRKPSHASGS